MRRFLIAFLILSTPCVIARCAEPDADAIALLHLAAAKQRASNAKPVATDTCKCGGYEVGCSCAAGGCKCDLKVGRESPCKCEPQCGGKIAVKPDLSAYSWRQLDDEQAALLRDGKQVGTLWFESGKFYVYDGATWAKATSEPPITRARKVARPAGACNGGCEPSCGCPANHGLPASACPCDASHRHYPPSPLSALTLPTAAECRT